VFLITVTINDASTSTLPNLDDSMYFCLLDLSEKRVHFIALAFETNLMCPRV